MSSSGRNRATNGDWNSRTTRRPDFDPANEAWVHDKYDSDHDNRSRSVSPTRARKTDGRNGRSRGDSALHKIVVRNLRRDITEEEFRNLFRSVGPIHAAYLIWSHDRPTGRGEVVYYHQDDALEAVSRFDGRSAKGQPIYLRLAPTERRASSRDGDKTHGLSERIVLDNARRSDASKAAPDNIDRYVSRSGAGPTRGDRGHDNDRKSDYISRDNNRNSDRERRSGIWDNERSGNIRNPRRGGGGVTGSGGDRSQQGSGKSRGGVALTREQLDAEMDDYFGSGTTHENAALTVENAAPDDTMRD